MLLSVKYEPGYNVGSSLGRKVCVSLHAVVFLFVRPIECSLPGFLDRVV